MVSEARCCLLSRIMALPKLGLDLIGQFLRVMILGASVKKITVFSVQVISSVIQFIVYLIIWPVILVTIAYRIRAADLLRLESSSADDIEKLAINELFEVYLIE